MRSKNERRHFAEIAVQRKLKAAGSLGFEQLSHEIKTQQGRLNKSTLIDLQESSHQSSNPRNNAISEKDKLTVTELSQKSSYERIEMQELTELMIEKRIAANDPHYMPEEIPSSGSVLN